MRSKHFVVVHWGVRRGLSRHHAMEIEISKRRKGLYIFVRNRIYSKVPLMRLMCNNFVTQYLIGKRRRRSYISVRAFE